MLLTVVQQRTGDDCGVHTIYNAWRFVKVRLNLQISKLGLLKLFPFLLIYQKIYLGINNTGYLSDNAISRLDKLIICQQTC